MLRDACGYKLANDGHDTRSLQAYLGHRNIQNTTRYTALAPDRFKTFLARLGRLFRSDIVQLPEPFKRSCPLSTSLSTIVMSALSQKQTFDRLFDHLVSSGDQHCGMAGPDAL